MQAKITSNIYLALTSVSFLWGTSFAAAKTGLAELTPINLVALRCIVASLVFSIILLSMRTGNKIERKDIGKFIVLGFLAITSYFYIQYTGLQYTTTIHSALIMATSPIYTGIFSSILGWEHLTLLSGIGILTAFTGVSTIVTNGQFADILHLDTIKGDLLLLTNAVIWAGFTLYGKSILQKYRPFVVMAYIHLFGTALLIPFVFTANPLAPIPLQNQLASISWSTVAAAMYLGLLCSVYAYFIWYTGVEKIGAVRTAVFTYFNPLFAIIAGILFMKESVTLFTLIGGFMVITGVYITNYKNFTPKKTAIESKAGM